MLVRTWITSAILAGGLAAGSIVAVSSAAPASVDAPASIFDEDASMILGWASHDLATMAAEEAAFGRSNDMLSTYVDFVQSPAFPTDYADAAEARGATLLIAWEPWDWNRPADQQPEFAPALIAAGGFDAYLSSWLSAAQQRTADAEIIVRFAPEMDDSTRPWSSGTAPGDTTPADYIAMWRHVYDLKEQLAPDVVMLWNPLNYGAGPHPFEAYFPGSDYVDALALDGFNWGYLPQSPAGWQSPDDVFGFTDPNGPVMRLKALAGTKPWGIAETASAPDTADDFQPGGPGYGAWGSWVYQWPQNPPYEQTADDWITQEGWSRMVIARAEAAGASFIDFFHTVKETDWRLTDTAVGREVLGSRL